MRSDGPDLLYLELSHGVKDPKGKRFPSIGVSLNGSVPFVSLPIVLGRTAVLRTDAVILNPQSADLYTKQKAWHIRSPKIETLWSQLSTYLQLPKCASTMESTKYKGLQKQSLVSELQILKIYSNPVLHPQTEQLITSSHLSPLYKNQTILLGVYIL